MREKISKSGDLRKFLSEAMHDVRYGHLEVDRAQAAVKAASQINESIRIECLANKIQAENRQTMQQFGALPLYIEG